ncbi:MAG: sugar-phosphatase [Vallitaleaceae bacterium]|nr:sugar-phosphatase [Vallitaleaceae bacterium]
MYKLIALDMDGTLLNEDKTISNRTKEAIRELKSKGKKVVLATGRPIHGVKRYVKELDLFDHDDYIVTFNGALVQSTTTNEILLNHPLSLDAYYELYELSKELSVHIHALTDTSVITPKDNPYTQIEAEINQIPLIEQSVESVSKDTLIVKIMFIDEAKKLDQIEKVLPQWVRDQYTIVRSAKIFLEFLNPLVDKGVGVQAVANKLGLSHENIICVGDAGNDLAMIQYASLGVAMGNATEELKLAANYITHSNNEDGVAHVIEKFMLR